MTANHSATWRPLRSTIAVLSVIIATAAFVAVLPTEPAEAAGPNCSQISVGYVPLIDGDGLYANGNVMPASHADSAPPVPPIDGIVGVASLGMSNGRQEWGTFMTLVQSMDGVSSSLTFANGAIGGKTMFDWANPSDDVWDMSLSRVEAAGLEANHVQIVWMKMGSKLDQLDASLEDRIETERGWLDETISNANVVFPNLKRIYISSRIYAGYSSSPGQAEPQTGYDNGLSVKAVVEDSIDGDTAVWTAWGPYLWADGTTPRSDGFSWECSDFERDGVHPAAPAEEKVANLLGSFFSSEETTCTWFLTDPNECGLVHVSGHGTPPPQRQFPGRWSTFAGV